MTHATMSAGQMSVLRAIRALPDADRSVVRAQVFSATKAAFGIPQEHKLKVEIDDRNSPNYGVLTRKKGDAAYELDSTGQWQGAVTHRRAYDAPAPTRWFALDLHEAVSDSVNHNDWDDGEELTAAQFADAVPFTAEGYTLIQLDGTVFVKLEEADL